MSDRLNEIMTSGVAFISPALRQARRDAYDKACNAFQDAWDQVGGTDKVPALLSWERPIESILKAQSITEAQRICGQVTAGIRMLMERE